MALLFGENRLAACMQGLQIEVAQGGHGGNISSIIPVLKLVARSSWLGNRKFVASFPWWRIAAKFFTLPCKWGGRIKKIL